MASSRARRVSGHLEAKFGSPLKAAFKAQLARGEPLGWREELKLIEAGTDFDSDLTEHAGGLLENIVDSWAQERPPWTSWKERQSV